MEAYHVGVRRQVDLDQAVEKGGPGEVAARAPEPNHLAAGTARAKAATVDEPSKDDGKYGIWKHAWRQRADK